MVVVVLLLAFRNSMTKVMAYFNLSFDDTDDSQHFDFRRNVKLFVDKFVEHEDEILEYFQVRDCSEFKSQKMELKHFVSDD